MHIYSPLDCVGEVLEDVPDLVFAFNAEGRYLYANKAAASFLGFGSAELIGAHWRELGLPQDVMEPLVARVQEVVATCEPTSYLLHGSPRYGSRIWDMSLTPMMCDRTEVVAVLAIAHDVTQYIKG